METVRLATGRKDSRSAIVTAGEEYSNLELRCKGGRRWTMVERAVERRELVKVEMSDLPSAL